MKDDFIKQSKFVEFETILNKLSEEINSIKGDYITNSEISQIENRQGRKIADVENAISIQLTNLEEGFVDQEGLSSWGDR